MALPVLGISSLVAGNWGGLLWLPMMLPLPVDHANWISFHGPLMLCGFLGTCMYSVCIAASDNGTRVPVTR
jgi:hypothetical protein